MALTKERLDVARRELWAALGKSTVYRQYLLHLDRGRVGLDNQNRLPWHAEGERQYAALVLSSVGTEKGATMEAVTPAAEEIDWVEFGMKGAADAMRASVYLWNGDIEDLADAAPLPKHVVSRDVMPTPIMFWSRNIARIAEDGGENNWLMLRQHPLGIEMFGDVTYSSADVRVRVGLIIPFGFIYPDQFPEGPARDMAGRILARLAFLNSPYVSPEVGRLPRSWRREAKRDATASPVVDPEIYVVQLRRDASENVVREREQGEGRAVEWKHQWWVSGHYRAQWYPSEEAHKVIWIAPYLKGPADKPIAKRVYAVVR